RHAQTIKKLTEIIERLLADVDLLCHGFHTCYVEAFHRKRRKFAPKEVFYASSWSLRAHYAHLHLHHGPLAVVELQKQLGLPIASHQAALINNLQQTYKKARAHDMSADVRQVR